jgi:hypothetical protein
VRTTLTLDDDVAARLKAEARRSGLPFRTVVNEHLRLGLAQRRTMQQAPPFVLKPHDFGGLRPGLSLDNVQELLDVIEGPDAK